MNDKIDMSNWLRALIGSAIVLIIGAIFWLGAAYQRFSGMEAHLISIDVQLAHLVDIQADLRLMREQALENQRRIQILEEQVRQLK